MHDEAAPVEDDIRKLLDQTNRKPAVTTSITLREKEFRIEVHQVREVISVLYPDFAGLAAYSE